MLYKALANIFTNDTPYDNFEYMISFDDVDRLMTFGKTWTKKDPAHWGTLVPKYWIHKEYCPVISLDNEDIFLVDLFNDADMKRYFDEKRFSVWEKV